MKPIFFRARYRSVVVPFVVFINIFVFMLWTFMGTSSFMEQNFLVSWNALEEGRFSTLLTSVFSHYSFFHIFINMYILTSFGSIVESAIGWKSFLKFYLIAGILSSLTHAVVSAFVLDAPELQALGASGAIAGVILVFSFLFPREKIYLLGFVPMPAIFGAMVFVGLDLWGLSAQAGGSGLPIGHGAHLGGSFTGMLYYYFFLRHRR